MSSYEECSICGEGFEPVSCCPECANTTLRARVAELESREGSLERDVQIARGELAHDRDVFNRILSHAEATARLSGAEAALEWAAEEMLRRDTEIRSFIKRGLEAVQKNAK